MKINIDRLMEEIERYATYGKQMSGGITRPSFSEEDYQVRELFSQQLKDLGMSVSVDAIANIWGTLEGDGRSEKPIVIGSHLDTVPNGGKFDGALGTLVAKEIVQTLVEQQQSLKHPIQVVSFTAEEANEFNFATMGSRSFVGKLTDKELKEAQNHEGLKLDDAVKRAGGDISQLANAATPSLAAFFELHIEQGKKLEKQNLPVGVVNSIVGIWRDTVIIDGEQNHSGTTMMNERKDALAAAGEMVASVQRLAKQLDTDAVATVGKFNVSPNAANIIPGRVEFILEVRSADKKERESLVHEIHQSFETIKNNHGVKMSIQNNYNTQESEFDKELVGLLEQSAETLNVPYTVIPSMAGHDAMHLAGVTRAAMLFVKSINGISHNPEELSLQEDIEQSANVLLNAVLLADEKLQ